MNYTRRELLTSAFPLLVSPLVAAKSRMKLSLSTRVVEAAGTSEKATVGFDEFVRLAARTGYQAICMRASLAGIQTPIDIVRQMRQALDSVGLRVSMVTGDFSVPANDDHCSGCLRKIGPYLNLAESFGADLIRVCMKKEEDIPWARRASDEAAERRIRLAHQSHLNSLFETVEGSLQVLEKIGHANFGLVYEPANWMIAGQDYGPKTIRRLPPWLMNVYLQNWALSPDGAVTLSTWTRGDVRAHRRVLWEKGSVEFERVFEGLDAVGYRGYVTVHQAFGGIATPEIAALKSSEYLKRFVFRKNGLP